MSLPAWSHHPSLCHGRGVPEANQTKPGPGCPLTAQVQGQEVLWEQRNHSWCWGCGRGSGCALQCQDTNRNPQGDVFTFIRALQMWRAPLRCWAVITQSMSINPSLQSCRLPRGWDLPVRSSHFHGQTGGGQVCLPHSPTADCRSPLPPGL